MGSQVTILDDEQLEAVSFAETPNAKTIKAINDVKKGKVTKCDNIDDLMNKLNS